MTTTPTVRIAAIVVTVILLAGCSTAAATPAPSATPTIAPTASAVAAAPFNVRTATKAD